LLPPLCRKGISPELKAMIDQCLTVDPKHRIEMKELARTAYMSSLISVMEGQPKDLACTSHTDLTCTSHSSAAKTKSAYEYVKQVHSYEVGLALLHYCRLVHKTCERTPSQILSQWLLNLCENLQGIRLEGG
jgi:serine/threonine protein kinase